MTVFRIWLAIKAACLIVLTLVAVSLMLELRKLAIDARASSAKLTQTLTDINRTVIVAGVTMSEVQKGALEWQRASRTQAQQVSQAMVHISETATAFGSFARTVEKSSSTTLDRASSLLDQQNEALLGNQARLSANLDALHDATERFAGLIDAGTAQVSNPAISSSLASLDIATSEFSATLTDLRQVADKARETYLKPVNLWWGLVKELLPLAGSAAQVVK